MPLPDWLQFEQRERISARLIRGLSGHLASWGELIATAQVLMAHLSDRDLSAESLSGLYDQAEARPLIAASRILDAAAQGAPNLDEEDRRDLALAAAVGFSMYGNFLSGEAALRASLNEGTALTPTECVIAATAAPNLLPLLLPISGPGSPERLYLEQLNSFLYGGDIHTSAALTDALRQCARRVEVPFHGTLIDSCRLSLAHIIQLSAARVLGTTSGNLPDGYIQGLVDSGVRVLLPPQYRAIAERDFLSQRGNAVISLPTGTGKTLLGELALVSALGNQPGLACYLAPYVALGEQTARVIQGHVRRSINVSRLMGGYRETEQINPRLRPEIAIGTPEGIDGLLRSNRELIDMLRVVVVDEAHGIESSPRGTRLEGLIARLRMLQEHGTQFRLVLMSAALSRYGNLLTWLGVGDEALIADPWKPTARRLGWWRDDGRLHYHLGDDPLALPSETPRTLVGSVVLEWPEKRFPEVREYWQRKAQEDRSRTNVAFIARSLWTAYESPILCVCATKAATRDLSRILGEQFDEIQPTSPGIQGLIDCITEQYPFLAKLAAQLRRGVAYHNASLPYEIRRLIEAAARARELRVVASTTTLAEGVDLPFRFTVLVDWVQWQGEGFGEMPPLTFRNIAGRCGRPRQFTEGDTIVYDNPANSASGSRLSAAQARREAQDRILFDADSDDLRSSLESNDQGTGRTRALAALSSQFLAAIPENPLEQDLVRSFGGHLFVAQTGESAADKAISTLTEIKDAILGGNGLALAREASPLELTPLGHAANLTGFSPETCRRLIRMLQEDPVPPDCSGAAHFLLKQVATSPEQQNDGLRKRLTGQRTTYVVKPEDLRYIFDSWMSGMDYEEIFAFLPALKSTKRVPSSAGWFTGQPGKSDWDSVYDDFYEFMTSTVEQFIPWVMRACEKLGGFTVGASSQLPWRVWAGMVQYGVDSWWAVEAMEAGAPGGHRVIGLVGRNWPDLFTSDDIVGAKFLLEDSTRPAIEQTFREVAKQLNDRELDQLSILRNWLGDRARERSRMDSASSAD